MSFNRDGTIYMLKKNKTYMFLLLSSIAMGKGESLYLLNGGKIKSLPYNNEKDIKYYFDIMELYASQITCLLDKYSNYQNAIAEFIRKIGGSGNIHGCIIDIEYQVNVPYSFCHLYINPQNGAIIPYYAENIMERIIYPNIKCLLEENFDCGNCKLMLGKYRELESSKALSTVIYTEITENENLCPSYSTGTALYKSSRIIKSLQHCTENNIIRVWNEMLLFYDFNKSDVNYIKATPEVKSIYSN